MKHFKVKRFTLRRYNPEWGSHLPILIKVLNMTEGPVLELGTGAFSTPVLHMLCEDKKRQLVSYESDQKYFEGHQDFISNSHQIKFVNDWKNTDITYAHWSVALVDHTTEDRRNAAIKLANSADYVIIHDSNGRFDKYYHYNEVYPYYKYRYVYDRIMPHTTVLSNFKDLSNL